MGFQIEISPEVASALISGTVAIIGGILSHFSNKRQTKKEIEKMKLEWEREDRVSAQQAESERLRELETAYTHMFSCIATFRNMPDPPNKAAAEAAVNDLASKETGKIAHDLEQLLLILDTSDGFEEPPLLSSFLEEIRVERRKQLGRQQASDTP